MSIKVLVVDDSLFMRTLITDLLNADPDIEVIGSAKSGAEALTAVPKLKPNVITLDLAMPGDDGLTTLERLMAERPTPILILSAHTKEGARVTLQCLQAGAVGYVPKPSGELSLDIGSVKVQLLEAVKAAASVNMDTLRRLAVKGPRRPGRRFAHHAKRLVVIGASTGGPQTLEMMLPMLPHDFPAPIIVAQHAPNRWFTEGFAERLQHQCALAAKVAEDGERVRAGTIYLAPSGVHLTLRGDPASEVVIELQPETSGGLTPSIDLTMASVAQVYREEAIGIILSGMGHDGLEGMKAIKRAGGRTLVQDHSALIFGMPKAVLDAGLADAALPASDLAEGMLDLVTKGARTP